MSWQDIVLTAGAWIFFFALLPSIFGKDKPALSTSIVTGSVLGSFVVAYASLSLWVSAASTSLVSIAWLTLAWQKYKDGRRQREEINQRD